MSRENVEIVRGLAEAFQRRDHERVFDFYDSEVEWDASWAANFVPDMAGVYRGHEGVRRYCPRGRRSYGLTAVVGPERLRS